MHTPCLWAAIVYKQQEFMKLPVSSRHNCQKGLRLLQVDVRALKELMWSNIEPVQAACEGQVMSFQDVIADMPQSSAAGRAEDLSVHLCFICLLHLANEHGLVVQATKDLDQLLVGLQQT